MVGGAAGRWGAAIDVAPATGRLRPAAGPAGSWQPCRRGCSGVLDAGVVEGVVCRYRLSMLVFRHYARITCVVRAVWRALTLVARCEVTLLFAAANCEGED
eukprot:scaffold4656_cov117-Isochrysis_galbana.AAC.7